MLTFMNRTKRNIMIFFSLVVFLAAVIVSFWLPPGYMIMGHDSGYRLFIPEFFRSLFSAWITTINFGGSGLFNPGVIPIHLPELIFSVVFRNPEGTQRAVLVFWHVVNLSAVLLAYLFVYEKNIKTKDFIIASVASILYGINFYNLHAWSVLWRTKFSTQFVLPFLVLFLYETFRLRRLDYRKIVLLALILAFFNGGGSPPLYGPLGVVWLTVGFYGIITASVRRQAAILFTKLTLVLSVVFFVLSAYWLIPYTVHALKSYAIQLQSQGGIGSIEVIVDAVSKNASFLNIFRLQGLPAWDRESLFPFMRMYVEHPVLIALSFIWVVLAIIACLLPKIKRERTFIGALLILLLIGAFFTAGSHPPTGWLFQWLVYLIPGFAIFRTAFYKFAMIPWFAISILVAYSIVNLADRVRDRSKNKLYGDTVLIGFVAFALLYHLPFLTGIFFDYNKPFTNKVAIPGYIQQMAEHVHRHTKPESKILLMPRLYGDRMDGYEWGYWGPDPLPHMVIDRGIVSDAYMPPSIVDAIYRAFYEKRFNDFQTLLAVAGIDTILWRSDVLYTDKETTGRDLQYLEEDLASVRGMSRAASFGAWRVYSVDSRSVWPLFYVPRQSIRTDAQYSEFIDAVSGAKETSGSQPILVSGTRSTVSSIEGGDFIKASCIWCDPRRRDVLESTADFVPIFLLPNSKFYFLIQAKEQAVLSSKRVSRRARAHTYYSFIRTRLSEIKRYLDKSEDSSYVYVHDAVHRISEYLKEARSALSSLKPTEKNETSAELITILKGYQFVVGTLHGDRFMEEEIRNLKDVMNQELTQLESETPYTKDPNNFSYVFTVDESGLYTISIRSVVPRTLELTLDGRRIDSDTTYLEKGMHTAEIVSRNERNTSIHPEIFAVSKDQSDSRNQEFIVPIEGENDYEMRFNYEAQGDMPAILVVTTEHNARGKEYTPETRWALASNVGRQSFRKTISTGQNASKLRFRFEPQEKEGSVSIKDFSLTRVDIPRAYFFQNDDLGNATQPEITYRTINRTKHKVTVEGASGRFILHFGQLFDPSWNAYIYESGNSGNIKKTAGVTHVKTNGYANGWIVDRTGDFEMLIEYGSQRFITLGLLISSVGFIVSTIFLIRRRS